MKPPVIPETRPPIDPTVADLILGEAEEHPTWADHQNRKGLLLLVRGLPAEARASFARCLELNPRYGWAALNHVQALALAGDVAAARSRLESAPEPAPGLGLLIGGFLDLLDPATAPAPGTSEIPGPLAGRPEFRRLAEARRAGGLPEDPLLLVPGLHQLFREASTWEGRLGNHDRADLLARGMLCFWSDLGSYWCQQAFLALLRGDDEAGLKANEEAVRSSPHSPEAMIGLAYYWSAQGEVERAHAALSEALRRAPRFADLRYQMGLLETARGRPDEALASFRTALEINPSYTVARMQEAEALAGLERWAEARDSVVRVLDAGLVSSDLYLRLGEIEERLGRPVQAEKAYESALQANPDDPAVHYHLGCFHRDRGEREKAKRAWRRFLVLAGESDQAAAIRTELENDSED